MTEKLSVKAENDVANILASLGEGYLSINDVVYTNHGYQTQIDNILISKYGIFVIETKYCDGYVIGNETDEQWKFVYDQSFEFRRNPLKQNDIHAKMISDKFKVNPEAIIKVIVFSDDAKLDDIAIAEDENIIHAADLEEFIKSFKEIKYYDDIYELKYLMKKHKGGDKARRKHLRSVVGKQNYFTKRLANYNRPYQSYQRGVQTC